MASSSPLSEPPSSPPRTPSRDSSRKRGSYDPSTPRTARRLRSTTRGPAPAKQRSPGREGSKVKGKEVGTPLTLRTGGPPTAGGLSPIRWQDYNVDDDDDDDDDDDSRRPPAAGGSRRDRASPTPAAKGSRKGRNFFLMSIDPGRMAANFRQNTPYHEVAPRGRPSGLVS